MQPATVTPFTQNASRAKGRESMRRNGERHYINHYPHFSVHYYPQKEPQEVWYREWDNELIAYGENLLTVYEELKANIPAILAEADTPYDPASPQPYIRTDTGEYLRAIWKRRGKHI